MAKYLTFADELIVEHGVKFHPDTVIVNADEVDKWCKANSTQLKPFLNHQEYEPLFDYVFVEFSWREDTSLVPVNYGCFVEYSHEEDGERHYNMALIIYVSPSQHKRLTTYGATWNLNTGEFSAYSTLGKNYNIRGIDIDGLSNYEPAIDIGKAWAEMCMAILLHTFLFMRQRGQIIEVDHPHKLARNIERRTGKPPSNYYRVIPVGPGVKQYKYKSAPQGTHASPRLHPVRPHIRIVENHPLPQFNGEFFIPAHFRGQGGSEGKARKIYRVVL